MNVHKHIDLLGRKVEDQVTGFKGVVVTVGFDLYGCIQAVVHPGLDKDGKNRETHWFDVSRLKVVGSKPVMERPNFVIGQVAEGKQGAAEKPAMTKV